MTVTTCHLDKSFHPSPCLTWFACQWSRYSRWISRYLDTDLSCHFILPAGQPRARAGCVLIKQKDAASLYFVNHPSFSGDIFTSPVPEHRVVTRIKIVGLRIDNGSGGCADNGTDFCAFITPSQSPVPGDPPCPAQPPTRCKHFL